MGRSFASFGSGVAAALVLGWFAFPHALYVRRTQPLEFRHKLHAGKSGMAQCNDCHTIREDGAFTAIPRVEACAACHAAQAGSSKAEAVLVSEYLKKGRDVPWLTSGRQPDNVWFSHAIHTRRAGLKCADCHRKSGESDVQPAAEMNRISGYYKRTLEMSACEDCHRRRSVETSCLSCHK